MANRKQGGHPLPAEKNENVLKGVSCPHCQQSKEFRLLAEVTVQVIDDGAYADDSSHYNWGDDSWTLCRKCEDEGTWRSFQTGSPEWHEAARPATAGSEKATRPGRGDPQLGRDFYGVMYIVVDDDGEPVSDYHMSLKRAREWREDHGGEAEMYRIAEVGFKALPRDDGQPDRIVDDPRAAGELAFVDKTEYFARHKPKPPFKRRILVRWGGKGLAWVFENDDGTFDFTLLDSVDPDIHELFHNLHQNRGVTLRPGLTKVATLAELEAMVREYLDELDDV